jgi:preprotein translocase subunit SecE
MLEPARGFSREAAVTKRNFGPNLHGCLAAERGGPSEGEVMAKVDPVKFIQEVRTETNKVTWPTRRETMITTGMVFVMSAVAAIFFLLADQVIRFGVTLVLGIGS